jgi:Flp pilus assembly protein TadD
MINQKKSSVGNLAVSKADRRVAQAVAYIDRGEHGKALAKLDAVLASAPDHYFARLNKGICLHQMGRFDAAARQVYAVHRGAPEDLTVLKICGITHCAAGSFDMALQFLQRYTRAKPEDFDAWSTMCLAASRAQKYTHAVMYATQALSIEPLNANAYNSLGSTLLAMNRLEEAEQAFQTALAIDPVNIIARSNLGTLAERRSNHTEAIRHYEAVFSRLNLESQEAAEFLYRSSFAYLGAGHLKEGWRRYAYGFQIRDLAARHPQRRFEVPQWGGESLHGQRLLIWGEQGIGDEIWFFGLLNEARKLCDNIIVECQPRLVSLFRRSFPEVLVRESNLSPLTRQDYDVHAPVGSLMALFCSDIEGFQKFKPYIVPSPSLQADFSERLRPYAGKKLVGICWRSGKIDAQRISSYLAIDDFAQLLKNPDCVFVNLQYGDCEEELQRVEKRLAVKIIRWHDVNLKDDQESVAALISQLHVVVSAGTAVARLADALGVRLLTFGPGRDWTFFGQMQDPTSWNGEYMCPDDDSPLYTVVPRIGTALA